MSEQFDVTDFDGQDDAVVLTEVPEIEAWSLEHFDDLIG